MIRVKLGIDPTEIKDVDDWIEAYTQVDYVLKVERRLQYSALKQAMTEVVNQLFRTKDQDDEE